MSTSTHQTSLLCTVLMCTSLVADMSTWWAGATNGASAIGSGAWNGLRTHCNPKNLWDDGTTGINMSLLMLGFWSIPLAYNMCLWKWRRYQVSRDINKNRGRRQRLKATPENVNTAYREQYGDEDDSTAFVQPAFRATAPLVMKLLDNAQRSIENVPKNEELPYIGHHQTPPNPPSEQECKSKNNKELSEALFQSGQAAGRNQGIESIACLIADYANPQADHAQLIRERNERIEIAQEKLTYPASYSQGTLATLGASALFLGAVGGTFALSTGFRTMWSYALNTSVKRFVTRVIPHVIIFHLVGYAANKATDYVFNRLESLRPEPSTVNLYDDSHLALKAKAARHSLFANTGKVLMISLLFFASARHLVHWRTRF